MSSSSKIKTSRFILFLAALYNLAWGALVSLFPESILFGALPTDFLNIILQCVGMLVGVYGIGYYIASLNPGKYWALVLVGLIGKALGPFGSLYYIYYLEKLTPEFFIVNVFNDIIWIIPFVWIVIEGYKGNLEIKSNESTDDTLYEKILGRNYELLTPNLKNFHSAKTPIRVEGFFKVERGNSKTSNLMADLTQLPKAIESEEVELVVSQSDGKEHWMRRIGETKVESVQWQSDHYLVEKFGVITMYLQAQVQNGNLIIKDVHSSLLGIPLPPFFTPEVIATGEDKDGGVLVDVDIKFYPVGRLIRYSGVVRVK